MKSTTLLRDYLQIQLLKLKKSDVQEQKNKSEMIIQHYLKISKADLYFKDISLDQKSIIDLNNMFNSLLVNLKHKLRLYLIKLIRLKQLMFLKITTI